MKRLGIELTHQGLDTSQRLKTAITHDRHRQINQLWDRNSFVNHGFVAASNTGGRENFFLMSEIQRRIKLPAKNSINKQQQKKTIRPTGTIRHVK